MKKVLTSLLALGIGVAAYSMSDRRKKRQWNKWMQQWNNIRFDRIFKQARKRVFS